MIFLNKKQWLVFSPSEMESFVRSVYDYYRQQGFPYYSEDEEYRKEKFIDFINYDDSLLYKKYLEDGIVRQTMHGLALCWSYMPHSFNVKCNDLLTPLEVFNDDEKFLKVIRKRIKLGDNMSDSGIRKMLRMFTGTQGVSNFRPSAATLIYRKWANGGRVWDMSAGYGGRLLGAVKAGVTEYVGTDPSTENLQALQKMKNELFPNNHCQLIKSGSEDYINPDYFDLCFTSPPYFNTEKYSNEITQSYLKFPSQELWLKGFLEKTIQNCFVNLKKAGIMILNIANVKNFNDLENKTISLAEQNGFKIKTIEKYALSHYGSQFKYEPIFVFEKVDKDISNH